MVEMTKAERNEKILLDIVEDYIKTAEPISSQQLLRKHGYALSSATIRSIMVELAESGFLYQPYISAGRIPTQKAYRFFVDKVALGLRKDPRKNKEEEKIHSNFQDELQKAMRGSPETAARIFAQYLSEITNTIAFVGILSINHFYREGLHRVLNEPEFLNTENIRSLVAYADSLQNRIDALYESIQNDIRIFIGDMDGESSTLFSLMAFTSELPNHEKAVFGIIGPMRMNYSENLQLLSIAKELFN